MATIKDVAKEAQVSIATVSRVINKSPKASQAAIERVTLAMAKLGYRPNAAAKALVSQTSQTIGVLVGDVADPFFGSLIKAVDIEAKKHQRHLLIGNGHHDKDEEKQAIELLIEHRCDALIVHSKALDNQTLIDFAQELPAMVLINRYIPEIAERCIALDNEFGSMLATEHLITLGHQKIGYICSNHEIEDATERRIGFEKRCQDANIDYQISYATPDQIGGEVAAQNLLQVFPNLTAIACYNDAMAAGVLAYLDDHGMSVPEDISLVGFDYGLIGQYIRPKLTSVAYPIEEMATQATQLALALSHGESLSTNTLVNGLTKPKLITQVSTRAYKSN